MKKYFSLVLFTILVITLSVVLSACSNKENSVDDSEVDEGYEISFSTVHSLAKDKGFTGTLDDLINAFKGESAYDLAVDNGYTGSQAEWLASLIGASGEKGNSGEKGETGEKGEVGMSGADGVTPHIGANGHWFIGETDTGINAKAVDGKDGKDGQAIELRISDGYLQWKYIDNANTSWGNLVSIASITQKGDAGKDGTNGKDGVDGKTPYIGENGNWWIGDEDTGILADYSDENRIATDGLAYNVQTINGKSGMVVSGFNSSLGGAVIIPNYVGSVPVIGVNGNVFTSNTKITSVSLSKNTVYLGDKAFDGCTALSLIDFNGCKLTSISDYAFRNTVIKTIELPSTLTSIGNYAFANTKLTSIELPTLVKTLGNYCFNNVSFETINYENVTYFGDYSLSGYYGGYVYLTDDVEFVGTYAFNSSYVYIEHDAVPSTWDTNIAGTNDLNKIITTNCKKNTEYIYSSDGTSVTVYRYIGTSKTLTIPSKIDNLTITRIGYGFNSLTDEAVELMAENGIIFETIPATFAKLQVLQEVHIPSTVTKIDYGAFVCYGTMIYIPSSVNTMYAGVGEFNQKNNSSFLAFESTTLPTFKEGLIDTSSSISESNWISNYYNTRYALGIDPIKVEFDEASKSFYYKEFLSYSLLASMDLISTKLEIKSTFNNLPVNTIRRNAVFGLANVKTVKIEDGINKIQGYAFDNVSLSIVAIPASVTTINAYGFDSVSQKYYIASVSKPSEWDSYWAGSSTSSTNILYDMANVNFSDDGKLIYSVVNNKIELAELLDSTNLIVIPNTIDGKSVTKIKSGFVTKNSAFTVLIPASVTTIESKAFTTSGYNCYITINSLSSETTARPTGWAEDYCYNSYYNKSDYKRENWGLTISQDRKYYYKKIGENIGLMNYYGDSSTIYIPRTVDGKTVVSISSNFILSSKALTIYIPNTITTIESQAFVISGTSAYSTIYSELSSRPASWSSSYFYNAYYGSSSYKYEYWSQVLGY